MAGHLGPPVIGHAFADLAWQAFHLAAEGFQCGGGGSSVHLAQNHEAGLALDQPAHRGAVASALDQIIRRAYAAALAATVPPHSTMAGDQAAFDLLRPVDNPQ